MTVFRTFLALRVGPECLFSRGQLYYINWDTKLASFINAEARNLKVFECFFEMI